MNNNDNKIYVPMDMHNCSYGADPDTYAGKQIISGEVTPKVHTFMRPLIEKLVRKRPEWEFVSYSYHRDHDEYGSVAYYSRFRIMQNGDELGFVDYESRSAGKTFIFDGNRLREKRRRGFVSGTIDVNKAFKTIIENIYSETLAERVKTAMNKTRSAVTSLNSAAGSRIYSAERDLMPAMQAFVRERWDEFMSSPMEPKQEAVREAYLELVQHKEDTGLFDRGKTAGSDVGGVTIQIMADGKYAYAKEGAFVGPMTGEQVKIGTLTTDQLPPAVKQGVGMLKLVDKGKHIPGIGIRVEDNLFFVVVDKEHVA